MIFQPVDHPVDFRRKISWVSNTKLTFLFFFAMTSCSLFFSSLSSCFSHNSTIVGKTEGAKPALWRELAWAGYIEYTSTAQMDGFLEVSFARRLKTPEGIARKVPGVWVLSLPTYFNCWPFFLNTRNCRFPSGDQLIFISKKGNSSFATAWTRSSFLGVGGFAPSVQISAVNFRCWFPAA